MTGLPPLRLTTHLRDALAERELPLEWVSRTIDDPELTEPDPLPHRWRHYRRIPEFGDRVLRVVVEVATDERVVISVFFDRGAKRKLR